MTRREALALLTAAGLTGCGGAGTGSQTRAVRKRSIAIDYASYYAPFPDLQRLVQAAAARRTAIVRFSNDPGGADAQQQSFELLSGADGGFRVVVVAPFDAQALAPAVRAAAADGVEVVSFITPVPGQTASITVDARDAARQLAEHAIAWARRHGVRSALAIAPPETAPVPDPFLPYAREGAQALAALLRAGGLRVTAVPALGATDAAPAVRGARLVVAYSDATALGAAGAVGARDYVGALAAPAITGSATLTALEAGPLRAVVAPRLTDLAGALVDLPYGLLHGAAARTLAVPAQRFTAANAGAAAADYAA